MAYMAPPTTGLDYTHMYDFVDYRGPKISGINLVPDTLLHFLATSPDYSHFYTIVQKSGFASKLNDSQAKYTLFLPDNSAFSQTPSIIDRDAAIKIMNFCTMNGRLFQKDVQEVPIFYMEPLLHDQRILVETNDEGDTFLDRCSYVKSWDKILSNGVIHTTSKLLFPVLY